MVVFVGSAALDDAVAAPEVLQHLGLATYPRLAVIWADSKYHNHALYAYIKNHVDGTWELEIVRRPPNTKGWVLLPKRWVAERTFAWLGRCRVHSKDYERLTESSEAMVRVSMIHLMLRRLKPYKEYADFQYRRKPA